MNNTARRIMTLLCIPVAALCQVRFSVSTERTNVAKDEQVVIVATLVTGKQVPGLAIPHIEAGTAFNLLKKQQQQSSSSSIQIINGRATQKNEITTQFYYVIAPRQTGQFTFPPLSVSIDNTEYRTEPLVFTVTDAPVSNPDIRSFLTLSKRSLFPGEQALLTFKVAQRIQSQGSNDVRNGFNGALGKIEEAFGSEFALTRLFTNNVSSGSERIDGEMYATYSLSFLLFPLNAGSYTIEPIPFEYQELRRSRRRSADPFFDDFFGGDFFGGSVQATPRTAFTDRVAIEVKQLPSPPQGFSGAVGSFSIQASATPNEVPAGGSVTLKVVLKGNTRPGNMGDIQIPKGKEYELFTPEKQMAVDTTENGFVTRKTYKYLLIPQNEGALVLNPVTFTYFDPAAAAYKTALSEPISIIVTKGDGRPKEQTRYLTQEEIREVGRDIRYITTKAAIRHQSRRPYRNPVFLLLLPLPFIIVMLSVLYRFQAAHRERNVARNIRNRALASALKQLSRLRKQAASLKPNDFLGSIASTIESYISQKFNFPATGRTLDELKEELSRLTSDGKTVADLTMFIERIDSYRFGGTTLDDASRLSILNQASTFLCGLEKGVKKEKRGV